MRCNGSLKKWQLLIFIFFFLIIFFSVSKNARLIDFFVTILKYDTRSCNITALVRMENEKINDIEKKWKWQKWNFTQFG